MFLESAFICPMTQETQTGALGQAAGWVGRETGGGQGGRGCGCTSSWFLLMYDRKPQNSVEQLKKKIASIKKNCFKVHSILTQIHVTTSFSLETVLRNLPTILNTI